MLPHAIYFETLASIDDDSSPEWQATVAGLTVLRLVDDWLDFGPHVVSTDISGLSAVKTAIAQIDASNPIQAILEKTVDVITHADEGAVRAVVPPLFAYAQALSYQGQSFLADDVLSSVRDRAIRDGDTETIIEASIKLGFVLRNLGKLELSQSSYQTARTHALSIGDLPNAFFARICETKIFTLNGDYQLADRICSEVASEAEKAGLERLVGHACHERAHIAQTKGDHQRCVRFAYQALEHIVDETYKDRIMADLAAAFGRLGHFAAARDTNLIISMCAQEPLSRWQATINLMFSAVMERQESAFDLYRATLELTPLDPRSEMYYRRAAAEGFRIFGRLDLVQEELRRLYALADKYNMRHLAAELDEIFAKQPEGVWEPDIEVIAEAMSQKLRFQTNAIA